MKLNLCSSLRATMRTHSTKRLARQTTYRRMWVLLIVVCVSVITFLHQARRSLQPMSDYLPLPVQMLKGKKLRNEFSLHIIADYHSIKARKELTKLTQCFEHERRQGSEGIPSCRIRCEYESSDVVLHVSEYLSDATRSEGLVLGVIPETLGKISKDLLHYQFPWKQLVMFYTMDTPLSLHKSAGLMRYIPFHVDFSYHDASFIYLAYAIKSETSRKHKVNIPAKYGLVAWMGPRSCPSEEEFWPRTDYVKKLGEHVKIDELSDICVNVTPCSSHLPRECRFSLEGYKFFLAFENAECNQYITDKFWTIALANDVVPVVYGPKKADYLAVAPPNSFIYAGDFHSPESLARYLKYLNEDQKEYFKYFKWKLTYKIEQLYPNLELSYFCNSIPFFEDVTQLDVQRVFKSDWYGSCRQTLSKGFESFKVEPIETWEPWKK